MFQFYPKVALLKCQELAYYLNVNLLERTMIAEQLSASFIKQESPIQQFPVEKGYFRSKILVTDAFNNPLIAAASPLISILERIQIASSLPDISILHQDISHEFKAFYSRFHRHHYSDEFHLIANYLLCATTDEIIGKSYLKLYGELKELTPLPQFLIIIWDLSIISLIL